VEEVTSRTPLAATLLALLFVGPGAVDPPPVDPLAAAVRAFVADAAFAGELRGRIEAHAARLAPALTAEPAALEALLTAQVVANLQAKASLATPGGERFPMSADDVRRTVVDYEAFKLGSYVTSGVFPKRYFGYFDGKWDTAAQERRLVEVVRACTDASNAFLAGQGDPWRVNDMEIAVTWVSEGGALLLAFDGAGDYGVHPVLGVGLDDIASGTAQLPGLVAGLDAAAGTDLASIVGGGVRDDGTPIAVLNRNMTFDETIVGTALMWVWEKRIAQRKLLAEGRPGLEGRSLPEQFVLSSLVYNSGLIHAAGREHDILNFDLADDIVTRSERNEHRRWALPVRRPADALSGLLAGEAYPDQPTSWLATYHVLQRYGGYEGLRRFTDVFDEQGRYRSERWQTPAP